MGSTESAPSTEHVHRLFRGASELSKKLKNYALAIEVFAAFVAGWRALFPHANWSGWASFWLAFLVILGFCTRVRAKYVYSFAEKCRRTATAAYACGRDVSTVVCTSLSAAAPFFAMRLSQKLPTQSLDDYYEPTTEAGNERLREIYAHSAYYSWRLLHWTFLAFALATFLLSLLGAAVVYALATNPQPADVSDRILDVVCSVIFTIFVARAADATLSAWFSARESQSVADELAGTVTSSRLHELVVNYDVERSSGPTVPTFIYLASRDHLQTEWHKRRAGLGQVV